MALPAILLGSAMLSIFLDLLIKMILLAICAYAAWLNFS